jgi:hypothetical protein
MTGPPNPRQLQSEPSTPASLRAFVRLGDRMTNSPNPTECLASLRLVPGIRRGTPAIANRRHRTSLPRIFAQARATPNQQLPRRSLELPWRSQHIAHRLHVQCGRRKARRCDQRLACKRYANPTIGSRAKFVAHSPLWTAELGCPYRRNVRQR